MEWCAFCCGDDDREYWMKDRISPKIGLSDDDLLDFQSDEGEVSSTPVVHHIHRSQLGRRSAGGRAVASGSVGSHASASKEPSKVLNRLESRAQGSCVSAPPRQSRERGPSRSIRSRHSLQASPPATVPSAEAGGPHTAAEGSRVPGPPPTKLAALSAEEKEEEKKRLQALVKEFAREAVSGFAIRLVNSETALHGEPGTAACVEIRQLYHSNPFGVHLFAGTQSDAKFTMDRFLTGIELSSSDEAVVPSVSLKMQNVKGIFKGDAAASRTSEAVKSVDQRQLLLLETSDGQSSVILAENQPKRDKVYTCLKILRRQGRGAQDRRRD